MDRTQLRGLVEFVQVVQEGSFSAAAEQLGTTRSRVSQVISSLEARTGVQLLQRSTRAMQLTDAGKAFYEQCQRGLAVIDEAYARAESDQQLHAGRIRINSVGGLFGEQILAPKLFEFMAEYPQIEVELDFSSARVDLIADHYDLAVRMGELEDSSLIARPLVRYATYTCASPAYLARAGRPSHPNELRRHALLSGSVRRWAFTHRTSGERQEHRMESATLHCANGHVALAAALAGLGIARCPAYYAQAHLDSGALVAVLPDWQAATSEVNMVYPQSRFRVRRVERLVEYLCTAFSHSN